MVDEPGNDSVSDSEQTIDLSGLQDLSFGPDWSTKSYARPQAPKVAENRGMRDGRRAAPRRDRRPPGKERRADRTGKRAPMGSATRPPFRPQVDVIFFPEEAAFKALGKVIRTSCRTFELFEIAYLILEKPERFVVNLRPLPNSSFEKANFCISVPDGLPFALEEEALDHVLQNYLENFFNMEEVDVEAPKGLFQIINRCSVTGELLGPPNFHRYQQLLQEHHANRLSNMSFEAFCRKIETSKDPELINKWVGKMTRQKQYSLKRVRDGKAPVFGSLESARHYLVTQARSQLVADAPTARFSGKELSRLSHGNVIRRSVEMALEEQRRFPLETANHLRGNLRRLRFNIYKRGSKGISFVCAVKRRFRDPDQAFAESIQNLLEFLESHDEICVTDLPRQFLGFDLSEPEGKVAQEPGEKNAQVVDQKDAEKQSAGEKDQAKLAQLRQDLRWLVSEGFVVEYSDGRLHLHPPQVPKKKKAEGRQSEHPEKAGGREGAEHPEKAAPESAEAVSGEMTPEAKADESGAEDIGEPKEGSEAAPSEGLAVSEGDIVVETEPKTPPEEGDDSPKPEST